MSEHTTRAVTIIQAHFRGYLARKRYLKMLLTLFEEEEEKRKEKERIQILEGEILIEKYRLRSRIAESITLNDNEERLANMMATRIQRAWKKYQNLKEPAHPQLKGQDQQDDSVVLDNCNILSIEEHFKAGARDTTSSYSTHKRSSSHHLHARNTEEQLDTEPTTIPQAATPTNNELHFEVSTDHPLYNCKEVPNSECSAGTEHKLKNKQDTLIHPVEHFGLGNSLNSGTNHDITLPTTVKSLESDDKGFAINSKEKVDSLDDRYHLYYTNELSDSSADEDKNWQAGQNFPDTAMVAAGYNLAMKGNIDCELDDFISDDQQQCTSHSVQIDHENVSPSKRKVLDHSFSPLHAMTLQQLRQLFLSLERQLSNHSRTLTEVLEEKDWLMNENELLKINIAYLARTAQSLYPTS